MKANRAGSQTRRNCTSRSLRVKMAILRQSDVTVDTISACSMGRKSGNSAMTMMP